MAIRATGIGSPLVLTIHSKDLATDIEWHSLQVH